MAQSVSSSSTGDVKLFSEFPPVDRSAWEKEIARTLEKQGKPGTSLDWNVADGVTLPPFLVAEDAASLPLAAEFPGLYPFTRSANPRQQDWSAQYYLQGASDLHERMAEAVRRGADGVTIAAGSGSAFYGEGRTAQEIGAAIRGFRMPDNHSPLRYEFVGETTELLTLARLLSDNALSETEWKGALFIDPYAEVLLHGDFSQKREEKSLFDDIRSTMDLLPGVPLMAVRADLFHSAGATPALELGLTLASVAELMQSLVDRGQRSEEILSRISLVQPVGSLYFVEMAKFRATRRLAAMLAKGFGIDTLVRPILPQTAVTSLYNMSIYDPYTNMLRACTESMAAILGGARSLVVLPLDAPFGRDDDFSRRMAVNTQLILRHESLLDRVADPAGGSYYIEAATDSIAEHAWRIFLEIEAEGGYRKALEKGTVQDRLTQAGNQRRENLAKRREIKLGVNQYPNTNEILRKSEFSNVRVSAAGAVPSGTRFRPALIGRGSAPFESLRLATEDFAEQKGHRPVIQLLPFGSLAMQRARAAFIVNFFGCAGFDVKDPGSLETPEACLSFAQSMQERPDAFVLCSADPEYAGSAQTLIPQLKKLDVPVLLAGNPAEGEALKAAGVEDFIHVRLNVYDTLVRYQQRFCA